ncbi:uncharacterized protein BP5553_03149 [Venustampulla echinocandica]|uniref:Cytochrome b5 heme-binding domain-containing protein n=1 Tax=Venustampulla echinocandica TaxID=2656787 RepID=A0A370TTE7_9HELO|nr:uncharacterized protein BP5553_03149 [Venustampulla echinocandica]RDL38809.1 hypothetical protein BP5553_03149 [Venustampulla echinocandica]
MVLLGLSILIVSVSFLCYRHPPSTWPLRQWQWLRRRPSPSIEQSKTKRQHSDAPAAITNHAPTTITTSRDKTAIEFATAVSGTATAPLVPKEALRADLDRKAMPPPPPPPLKKQKLNPKPDSPPTTPRAATTTESPTTPTVPSFTFGLEDDTDSLPPPSFPAANSAQRASTGAGARVPPRLNPVLAFTQPAQASGMMPPPRRGPLPLPNRTPAAASSSLAPPPTHTAIPTKPRKKVLLTPGHSPLDWARLSSSPTANLRGLPPSTGYLRVPPSLLKQHNGRKGKDAWTVLGGRVYNITPYLPYHPGGVPELIRVAGRDGSKLFGEVHPWVNWEGMLEGCLIGMAVEEGERGSSLEDMD